MVNWINVLMHKCKIHPYVSSYWNIGVLWLQIPSLFLLKGTWSIFRLQVALGRGTLAHLQHEYQRNSCLLHWELGDTHCQVPALKSPYNWVHFSLLLKRLTTTLRLTLQNDLLLGAMSIIERDIFPPIKQASGLLTWCYKNWCASGVIDSLSPTTIVVALKLLSPWPAPFRGMTEKLCTWQGLR